MHILNSFSSQPGTNQLLNRLACHFQFITYNLGATTSFEKLNELISSYPKTFLVPDTFFPDISPASETVVSLLHVLCTYYAICRYMSAVGFHYNFLTVSAQQYAAILVSWFYTLQYRLVKHDLIPRRKVYLQFRCFYGSLVMVMDHDEQNMCPLVKEGTVLKPLFIL